MESNRAGVASRLGLGYEEMTALRDDLVYLSITGFGQEGSYASRPATDAVLQAFSGLMMSNPDKDGAPKRVEFPVPDYITGLVAYQTLVTALFGRAMHGGSRRLDISLMQAMLLFQQQGLIAREIDPTPPKGSPVPPTGTYATSDGYINISVVREKFFKAFVRCWRCRMWAPIHVSVASKIAGPMSMRCCRPSSKQFEAGALKSSRRPWLRPTYRMQL